jgi:TRAP-type C4-dicarboxylate transport system substrate-binding protein
MDMKFHEVAKHLTLTNHMYNAQALIMSKKTSDKLSEDERKIIREAAAEMAPYQRKASRDLSAKALDQIKQEGVEVVELPPEEVAKLRERAKPVIDKYTQEIGADFVNEVYAEVEKARGRS